MSIVFEHDLSYPPKPDGLTPKQQAREVAEWVNGTVPYQDNGIFTLEEASQRQENGEPRGGICFVQSLGAVALMHNWDIPAGVVLSRTHASSVGLFGEKDQEELLFLDPSMCLEPRTVGERLAHYKATNLALTYRDTLAHALQNDESFIQIYYQKHHECYPWKELHTDRIRDHKLNRGIHNVHAVMDSGTAHKTLTAIGELNQVARSQPNAYRRKYQSLSKHVPEFYALDPVNYYAAYDD